MSPPACRPGRTRSTGRWCWTWLRPRGSARCVIADVRQVGRRGSPSRWITTLPDGQVLEVRDLGGQCGGEAGFPGVDPGRGSPRRQDRRVGAGPPVAHHRHPLRRGTPVSRAEGVDGLVAAVGWFPVGFGHAQDVDAGVAAQLGGHVAGSGDLRHRLPWGSWLPGCVADTQPHQGHECPAAVRVRRPGGGLHLVARAGRRPGVLPRRQEP